MKRDGCDCTACRECCQREPGWFVPDEIPAAAKFLGLSEAEFITRYCAKHPLENGTALSPATKPGSTTCIFFEKGKCSIHDVKPYECRKVFGCDPARRHARVRDWITAKWK
ncbi:MAG: YkgJ family cysteine cluster protein [Deltaproteobacteria bacterium]|nr:YkgJ family cysteine cluster protein [Deltaproteobacteria bacterium]